MGVINERMANLPTEFVLGGIGRLMTNDPRRSDLLGVVERAAIHIRDGRVVWIGHDSNRPRYVEAVLECGGRMVAPAFVDPHVTPLLPAGGVGDDLIRDSMRRVGAMMTHGTGTVGFVCRAGDTQRTAMRVSIARRISDELPMEVVPIHEMPPDVTGSAVLEGVRTTDVAAVFDVGVDHGLAERLLVELARLGQRTRVHGGGAVGARLAVESSALCWVADRGPTEALGESLTAADVVVVADGDAGAWWDSGVVVALSTHHRAGEGRVVSMQWAIGEAVRNGGMDPDAALWAATRGGALALDRRGRGVVVEGGASDVVVLDAEAPSDVSSQPDVNLIHRLVIGGEITDMTGLSNGFA